MRIAELSEAQAEERSDALAAVLLDAVAGGASVGYMADLSRDDAAAFWREAIAGIAAGGTLLFAALEGDALSGTVLFHPCRKPNQLHRADVAKLLVVQSSRRAGIGSRLMDALETRALALGRNLLTLDTASGSEAESFYRRRGYVRAGEIPGYTLMPDGSLNGTALYYKQLG